MQLYTKKIFKKRKKNVITKVKKIFPNISLYITLMKGCSLLTSLSNIKIIFILIKIFFKKKKIKH